MTNLSNNRQRVEHPLILASALALQLESITRTRFAAASACEEEEAVWRAGWTILPASETGSHALALSSFLQSWQEQSERIDWVI